MSKCKHQDCENTATVKDYMDNNICLQCAEREVEFEGASSADYEVIPELMRL